jgi:hypothetical protein
MLRILTDSLIGFSVKIRVICGFRVQLIFGVDERRAVRGMLVHGNV